MMDFIPYGKQYIDKKDRGAVKEVLKSPFITESLKRKYAHIQKQNMPLPYQTVRRLFI